MERFNQSLIKPSACIFFYCEQLSVMHQTLGFKRGITDVSKYSVSGTELKCTPAESIEINVLYIKWMGCF